MTQSTPGSVPRPFSFKSAIRILAFGAALLGGCGHTNYNTGYGNTFVTYTASGGDFASYVVTISSITLTRSDGTVATGVSAAEVVDLAKLTDVAEMVSNTTIPIGTYKSATVNIDYTNASVFVNVNGVPTAAKVVDASGAAITALPVIVTFDPSNPLVIPQSGAQRANFVFDLAASNSINYSTLKVTAKPYVTVNNDSNTTKPIRVRGPIVSYNSEQGTGTYTVYVRPFLDEANNLGSLTLFASPSTSFVIDNQGFVGAAGVNAVTNLGTGAISSALTTFTPDKSAGSFNLTQSYIGTSVENINADRVEGTVIARTGNTITLRDTTLSLRTGTFTYYPSNSTVTLADATVVTIDGQPAATGVTQHSVSVGQKIIALGQATVTSGIVAVNATAGRVRLLPTRLWGTLTAGGVGTGTMALQSIGEWPSTVFNFTGTTVNPAAYSISSGTIDLTGLQGQPAAVDGIVAGFGAEPPDFLATAASAVSSVDSRMSVEWGTAGTLSPFISVSSSNLIANITDAPTVHVLVAGGIRTDLLSLASSPSIVPATSGRSTFSIGNQTAGISVFSKFSDFVAQLNSASTAGKAALRIALTGHYDSATNTLTASEISVVLK